MRSRHYITLGYAQRFFEEAFKRKAEAKKAGNKALAQVWKIIINSAYGFWGIRVEDKDSVLIQEKGACDIHDYINRGKFLNYTEIGKYGIARVLKDLPIKDFNVGVASAISSYSRCRLWSLIDGIESKGKHGFRVSQYGVHLFHTKFDRLWEYVKKFSEWMPCEHRVKR